MSKKNPLIDLIAKRRGIKRKSAANWLYRAKSGKTKKPDFSGLSDYAVRKVRNQIAASKRERERAKPAAERSGREKTKQGFDHVGFQGRVLILDESAAGKPNPLFERKFPAARICAVNADFLISRDRTSRTIRLYVNGPGELFDVLQAGSLFDAVGHWSMLSDGEFLAGATIYKINSIAVL